MTTLDWLIVAATAMFAISGYFRGLIVGALSLGGFIGGAIAGSRIADALLAGGASSPYAPLCGLIGRWSPAGCWRSAWRASESACGAGSGCRSWACSTALPAPH
jgi:hypothetical protein